MIKYIVLFLSILIIVILVKILYGFFGYDIFYFGLILKICYHFYIIFNKGIYKKDFNKENISSMEPVGASSLIWLIFSLFLLGLLYF